MIEKLMTLLVGILLALAGWSLTRTFELSTQQAVLLNQVDQLEFSMQMLEEKMNKMIDSDEEIMDQHKKLFEKLESGNTGYNYN
jgi:predicted nuclease with TOPRIM domain